MKVTKYIIGFFNAVGVVATFAMLTIVFFDVLLRFLFNTPIVGATELGQILLVCVFAGVSTTIIEQRNIKVDLLMNNIPKAAARIIDLIILVITFAFLLLIAWQAFVSSGVSRAFNVIYSLIRIPQWPLFIVLALSLCAGAFATAVLFIQLLTGKEADAGAPGGPGSPGAPGAEPPEKVQAKSEGGDDR